MTPHNPKLVRPCRALVLACAVLTPGCEGSEWSELLSWLPFDVPFLSQDAGASPALPLDAGPIDAAGYRVDAGVPEVGEGEECSAARCVLGWDCVVVSALERRCLRPCGGGCASAQRCEELLPGPYCLDVVGRGERCEVKACTAGEGLRCLPARVEGGRVLAYTCQRPCPLGDPAGGGCAGGESCLPSGVGQLELQGGVAVPCDLVACGSAGACGCAAGFGCVEHGGGGVCARPAGVCGRPVGAGDPALLGEAALWPDGGTCDPGPGQRYCAVDGLDAGTPVWCAQGGSADLTGVCVAVCQEPVGSGEAPVSYPCPPGFTCSADHTLLGLVAAPERACGHVSDCVPDAGERCVGPLPAYEMGWRCVLPLGLCYPPGHRLDAGPSDAGRAD